MLGADWSFQVLDAALGEQTPHTKRRRNRRRDVIGKRRFDALITRRRGKGRPQDLYPAAALGGDQIVSEVDHGTANSLAQAFGLCQALPEIILGDFG